ncbi:MAG: alpha/beta-type small acid-soluble spore protein [Christensenellaceae bacterium]|nr:alpha/beta-type small acid-soluble spore protein [Christensenellaceae bacterium]
MYFNNQNGQNQAQGQNQIPATQSSSSSNQQGAMVPEARQALDNMKYEIAGELGINLKQGYNGDLPSRQAGSIGGYMVKRLIEQAERQMAGR